VYIEISDHHKFADNETVMTGSREYLHAGAEWKPFWRSKLTKV